MHVTEDHLRASSMWTICFGDPRYIIALTLASLMASRKGGLRTLGRQLRDQLVDGSDDLFGLTAVNSPAVPAQPGTFRRCACSSSSFQVSPGIDGLAVALLVCCQCRRSRKLKREHFDPGGRHV
jgi:hypothetical protein